MRTVRVYSEQPVSTGDRIKLHDDAARHVARVLRMRTGDSIVIFDGHGTDYEATITVSDRNSVEVHIDKQTPGIAESPLHITLWHGICRGSRMDFVIQKATELGVNAIQPVLVERSVVKLDEQRSRKKASHWQGVAISAAEQCGRSLVPEVSAALALEDCLQQLNPASRGIILHPGGDTNISAAIAGADRLVLLTGPEGGFTDAECAGASDAGFQVVSMGPRILRSETAPLAALAIVQSIAGDL